MDYLNNISRIILIEDDNKSELNRLTNENQSYGIYKIEFSPYDSYVTYTVRENIPGDWVRFKSYMYVLNIANNDARFVDKAEDSHWNSLGNF